MHPNKSTSRKTMDELEVNTGSALPQHCYNCIYKVNIMYITNLQVVLSENIYWSLRALRCNSTSSPSECAGHCWHCKRSATSPGWLQNLKWEICTSPHRTTEDTPNFAEELILRHIRRQCNFAHQPGLRKSITISGNLYNFPIK